LRKPTRAAYALAPSATIGVGSPVLDERRAQVAQRDAVHTHVSDDVHEHLELPDGPTELVAHRGRGRRLE
jgi:hypothetical protein